MDWRDLSLLDYEYMCEGLMARSETGSEEGLSDSKADRLRRFSKARREESVH